MVGERPLKAPLSKAQYPWKSEESPPEPGGGKDLGPGVKLSVVPRYDTGRDGRALREVRVRYQLTLGDLARGWGVSPVEVSEVERGLRRFPTTDILRGVLDQIWVWHLELRAQGEATAEHPPPPRFRPAPT